MQRQPATRVLHQSNQEIWMDKGCINIRGFLLEMGSDYTFVGNQYRLEVGGQEFFIDLLLYHRKLQFVIVSLMA
jgi:predicted nuclease of restriction endonuclease-like (RecB) superfamily